MGWISFFFWGTFHSMQPRCYEIIYFVMVGLYAVGGILKLKWISFFFWGTFCSKQPRCYEMIYFVMVGLFATES